MKQTTVKAKKKSGGHKTEHVSIHPAENGFTVRHHKKAPERKGGMNSMYTPPPDPEETVHEDRDSMLNRIGQIFPGGGDGGAPDGGAAPAAGGTDQAE